MHPLRCTIVRPRVGYVPLGSEPGLQTVLEKEQKLLTKAIINAVIKSAAFNTGIQIALMCIPVIGQAIAGLMALMNMILGQVYQNAIKRVIANTMEAIKVRGEQARARVEEVGSQLCREEYPAAMQMAMSSQPLGDFWSRLVKAPDRIVRKVGHQVREIVVDPQKQMKFLTTISSPFGLIRLGVKAAENVVIGGAKLVEDANIVKEGSISEPLKEVRDTVDDVGFSAQKATSPFTTVQESTGLIAKHGTAVVAAAMEATGNEKGAEEVRKIGNQIHGAAQDMMTAATPTGGYNLFSGREGLLAARAACEHMRERAFASIDAEAAEAIVKFKSPEGRQNTRIALAKALRNDPDFMAQVQELRDLEAQQRQPIDDYTALLEQEAGPPSSSGAGTLLGVAAAGAAAFMIAR